MFCTNWKVLVVLSYVLCPASLYTITSISYDRYLSLQMKIKYKTVVTKRKACVTVVILWVWAGLGVTLIGIVGKTPFLILVCCVTFFCLGVIIDCYLLCGTAIRKHQKEILASTTVRKAKPKQDRSRQENLRVNKGRKGIKRPIESFGLECDERKRLAKSRDSGTIDAIGQFKSRDLYKEDDAIGQFESRDFYKDDDSIGERESMEDEDGEEKFNNERFVDIELEDDENAMESEDECSQFSTQNPKEDSGKRRLTTSSVNRMKQVEILGGKTQRHSLDPSNLKYILVNKDIGSVIEEVEIEEKYARKTELGDNRNDEAKQKHKMNEQKKQLNAQQADTCRLTFKKAQLLADIKKFKQTLHTILMIVVSLFLCYLPYMIVSTLVNLGILDIGISWDLAGMTVYLNSSISPIIMCTRISSIRQACRRILRRMFGC